MLRDPVQYIPTLSKQLVRGSIADEAAHIWLKIDLQMTKLNAGLTEIAIICQGFRERERHFYERCQLCVRCHSGLGSRHFAAKLSDWNLANFRGEQLNEYASFSYVTCAAPFPSGL